MSTINMPNPIDYIEAEPANSDGTGTTSAGNNPSTWAGVMVIAALGLLLVTRRSFRRFM